MTAVAAGAGRRRAEPGGPLRDPGERRLIEALAIRYASPRSGRPPPTDSAYARALGRVVVTTPEDLEARTLYADALMNLSPWNYWRSGRLTAKK
ncbi:MAG: hypothetical protein R2882_10660 [Gemmatimonadales bacterium]